jgi:hypothetical protein
VECRVAVFFLVSDACNHGCLYLVDNFGNTAGDIALSFNNEACYMAIRDAGIRTGACSQNRPPQKKKEKKEKKKILTICVQDSFRLFSPLERPPSMDPQLSLFSPQNPLQRTQQKPFSLLVWYSKRTPLVNMSVWSTLAERRSV